MFKQLSTVAAVLLAFVCAEPAASQSGAPNGEWPTYGGDLFSTKYAPLDQIGADNFAELEVAWRWQSADAWLSLSHENGELYAPADTVFAELQKENPERWRNRQAPRLAGLKATPLMVDGVLYVITALYQAAAIDAVTGETLWVFNPKSYETGTPTMSIYWNHRGAAYWSDGDDARIYWGTGDAYLYSVDAKTGIPIEQFGTHGRIDLMEQLPRANRDERDYLNALLYSCASPPLVVGNTIVSGGSVADRRVMKEAVPGWVQAFDVRTGEPKWTFRTVPQEGDFGVETWENDSWTYSGNTNVWTQMSADPELGYVYLPTGTPTNDFYGGHRLGDNLFAESVVCLDAETGERVWHFQTVHHGLWDYDNPAAPNLMDITVDGQPRKAVAQVTKQGFIFTFDRVTGDPIWPIEERGVPTHTDMPGERPSPTQPFPTKPRPIEYQGVSEDDLIDFTPELRQEALEILKDYTIGPLYTPPQMKQTILRPGLGGGPNWTGAAFDPETGWLYVPSQADYSVVAFYSPEDEGIGTLKFTHGARGGRAQGPRSLPLFKPPYSRIVAIDMNCGEVVWDRPNGPGNAVRNHPDLKDLNLPEVGDDFRGAPLLTKTLLIIGRNPREGEPHLAAVDKRTGETLATVPLPGRPLGAPMTYVVNDRQYVALTVGTPVPEVVALTLPESD